MHKQWQPATPTRAESYQKHPNQNITNHVGFLQPEEVHAHKMCPTDDDGDLDMMDT